MGGGFFSGDGSGCDRGGNSGGDGSGGDTGSDGGVAFGGCWVWVVIVMVMALCGCVNVGHAWAYLGYLLVQIPPKYTHRFKSLKM